MLNPSFEPIGESREPGATQPIPPISSASSSSAPVTDTAASLLGGMSTQPLTSRGAGPSMPLPREGSPITSSIATGAGITPGQAPIDREHLVKRLKRANLWRENEQEVADSFEKDATLTHLIRPSSTGEAFTLTFRIGAKGEKIKISQSVAYHVGSCQFNVEPSRVAEKLQRQKPGSFQLVFRSGGRVDLLLRTLDSIRIVPFSAAEMETIDLAGRLRDEQMASLQQNGLIIGSRQDLDGSGLVSEAPLHYRCWLSQSKPGHLGVGMVKRDEKGQVADPPQYALFTVPIDDMLLYRLSRYKGHAMQLEVLADQRVVAKSLAEVEDALFSSPTPFTYRLFIDERSGWVMMLRRDLDGAIRGTPFHPDGDFWLRLHQLTTFEGYMREQFSDRYFFGYEQAYDSVAKGSPGSYAICRPPFLDRELIYDSKVLEFLKKMPDGNVWRRTFTIEDISSPGFFDYLRGSDSDLEYLKDKHYYFDEESEAFSFSLPDRNQGDFCIVPVSSEQGKPFPNRFSLFVKLTDPFDDDMEAYTNLGDRPLRERYARFEVSSEEVAVKGWFPVIRERLASVAMAPVGVEASSDVVTVRRNGVVLNEARLIFIGALREMGSDLKNSATYLECLQEYRKLAKKLHPDRGGTGEQFKALGRAIDAYKQVIETKGMVVEGEVYRVNEKTMVMIDQALQQHSGG